MPEDETDERWTDEESGETPFHELSPCQLYGHLFDDDGWCECGERRDDEE